MNFSWVSLRPHLVLLLDFETKMAEFTRETSYPSETNYPSETDAVRRRIIKQNSSSRRANRRINCLRRMIRL